MLIVHHWDTDGVCSAAKIVKALKPSSFVNMSPVIGEFNFNDRIRNAMDEHDDIFIVDLNLPGELERVKKKVTFIDHHIQGRVQNELVDHINPLLDGGDMKEYPSCTTVISEHFGDWDLLSSLGAIGDVGEKAIQNPAVKEQLDKAGIGLKEAERIVTLIDTNYLAVDIEGVEEAVKLVLSLSYHEMLKHPPWVERDQDIQGAMDSCMARREDLDGFTVIDITSPYNIVSKLARKAVWELGYSGALVINRDFHGKGQTYFRIDQETSKRIDIASIIAGLREIGINAGGKREVVGCIYPIERTEEVLDIFRPHLPASIQGGNHI
ncbi:MAG: DHH family phosphoesterase [Candidatus Thermoplasmatota archaeon]|nr:DHH family phosphoesterase [Candidatus Thermoplasmatota archaeon]